MTDTSLTLLDISRQPRSPAYRVVVIAESGTVVNAVRLVAENDEQALARAKAMVDGHAVELWDGLRFIEHFPPVEPK